MKLALTILLITGFVSVAVFGFIGISHITEAAHQGCLAALSQNGICPSATSLPLSSAFYHLNILRSFSVALIVNAALILALAAVVLFALKNDSTAQGALGISRLFSYVRRASSVANDFLSSNLSWLNLHLNSPSFAASA